MRLQLRPRDDCLDVAVRLAGGNVDVILELRQDRMIVNTCSHSNSRTGIVFSLGSIVPRLGDAERRMWTSAVA